MGGGSGGGAPAPDGGVAPLDAGASSTDAGTHAPSEPDFAACGGAIFDTAFNLDPTEYAKQARQWDRATADCRLGPKYADLNPGASAPRPTAFAPEHRVAAHGYLCPKYELSGTCAGSCDYGSTSGPVLYLPDAPEGTGAERVQNYAYESGVICESLQAGSWLGGPRPEPALKTWSDLLGQPVRQPNGFAETEFQETNGGIMIFPEGLVGATGNQHGSENKASYLLPPNKVPTAVAVTTYNELAFVTVWDTDALKGQVAIFALRSVKPPAFSIPYFALPNEGAFSGIHLIGYVDLPFRTPTSISVSGDNGNTPGGHTPGFEFGSQTDPTKNFVTSLTARAALANTNHERRVPMAGQAVIASRWENQVAFLDLRPLTQFIREVYFGPDDSKRIAAANQTSWPFTFDTNPEARPLVVTTVSTPHPTAVRVGNQGSPSPTDLRKPIKAWVANLEGAVKIYDLSGFAFDAARPVPAASVTQLAQIQAGRNLTALTRQGNNSVLAVSRGDRRLEWVGISDAAPGTLAILRTLEDSRIEDPVAIDASDRGPVVTVGDFSGKRLLNFRVGVTENNPRKPPAKFGCGAGGADPTCEHFEFGGSFELPGTPFFFGTSNVN